jgi:diguanylate cyclase (GGDEF)-like protein/PAS domain S-box-containing protein
MKDSSRTKQELIEELSILKNKIKKLQLSESDRKQTEEALRKSEGNFRHFLDDSPLGMRISTSEAETIYVNQAMLDIYGYDSVEEMKRMPVKERYTPQSYAEYKIRKEKREQGELGPSEYEISIVRKNGEVRHLQAFHKEILWNGVKQAQIIYQDITERRRAEKKLINSEEKFRTLAESSSFAIMMHQGDRWIYANRAAKEISGYTEEDLYSMHFWDFVHPDHRDLVKQSGLDRQQGKVLPRAYEFKIIAKNGVEKWLSLTGNSIQYEDKPTALISVTDITERRRAEEALRESEERYRTLVENASDMVFRLDNTGHITFVNPAALRIMGYEEKEIIGRHYPTFIRSDMQEEAMKFFGRQFVKGIPNTYSEYPVIVKDGREIWLGQNTQLIFQDSKVVAFQAVARDITERKRIGEALQDSENRYRELSIVDDLTQLYNSRHFYFQLKIELERSNRYEHPLTLLMLDLDDFKAFNDTYGHIEGDRVLRRLGQMVKRCLRETDLAFRYGGEEFTIILPMTTSADGSVTAERIRTEFKKENFSPAPGQEFYLTVSIGLSQYKPKEDMKTFVHRVDQLMYQGKKNGKDRVCSEL